MIRYEKKTAAEILRPIKVYKLNERLIYTDSAHGKTLKLAVKTGF
jgi:hypothetical protein